MKTLTGDALTACMGAAGTSAKAEANKSNNDCDAKQQDTNPDGQLRPVAQLGKVGLKGFG